MEASSLLSRAGSATASTAKRGATIVAISAVAATAVFFTALVLKKAFPKSWKKLAEQPETNE